MYQSDISAQLFPQRAFSGGVREPGKSRVPRVEWQRDFFRDVILAPVCYYLTTKIDLVLKSPITPSGESAASLEERSVEPREHGDSLVSTM